MFLFVFQGFVGISELVNVIISSPSIEGAGGVVTAVVDYTGQDDSLTANSSGMSQAIGSMSNALGSKESYIARQRIRTLCRMH